MEELTALKAAREAGTDYEFHRNETPKCPHCGSDFDISENEAWELYDGDEGDHVVTCDSCDTAFTVSVHVSFDFSTDEQPDDDED